LSAARKVTGGTDETCTMSCVDVDADAATLVAAENCCTLTEEDDLWTAEDDGAIDAAGAASVTIGAVVGGLLDAIVSAGGR
jgi:hypothetical protein